MRVLFIRMHFATILLSMRWIMIKHVRKLHRLVAHDLLIIAVWWAYFCIYYVGPKLPIQLLGH